MGHQELNFADRVSGLRRSLPVWMSGLLLLVLVAGAVQVMPMPTALAQQGGTIVHDSAVDFAPTC
ncbi:MAG: hypothetical protein KDE23_27280, partial [Caldilinea sp.]|nr:hypothetical protein [Caldilinea sp.]